MEAANNNMKRILRKMTQNYKSWHEKLPNSFLGYCTTIRTSSGVTLSISVYRIEAVIPGEVEIPSLWIIQKSGLNDAESFRDLYEQLALIDEKRISVFCHVQLYQYIMTHAMISNISGRPIGVEIHFPSKRQI